MVQRLCYGDTLGKNLGDGTPMGAPYDPARGIVFFISSIVSHG